MITKRSLTVAVFVVFALLLALTYAQPEAQAQSGTPGSTFTVTLLAQAEAARFTSIPYNGPLGGVALGVTITSNWNSYNLDTLAAFQRSCDLVRVYRMTEFGDLILHPSTCSGELFSFGSVGTGAYFFYGFGSASAAQLAQMDVLWLARLTPTPNALAVSANPLMLAAADWQVYLSVPRSGPSGGLALGAMRATDYTAYSLDTMLTFRRSCDLVRAYRVTPFGDFILHPSACVGNILNFTSVGTGHYIFYVFGSALAAQNAQVNALWIHPTPTPTP